MLPAIIIIISLLILFFVIGEYKVHLERRQRAKIFEPRAPMTKEEFYQKYYASSAIPKYVVDQAIELVANECDAPACKLLPSDRFESELNPPDMFSHGLDRIINEVYFLANKEKILEIDKIKTLDEFIRVIAPQLHFSPEGQIYKINKDNVHLIGSILDLIHDHDFDSEGVVFDKEKKIFMIPFGGITYGRKLGGPPFQHQLIISKAIDYQIKDTEGIAIYPLNELRVHDDTVFFVFSIPMKLKVMIEPDYEIEVKLAETPA